MPRPPTTQAPKRKSPNDIDVYVGNRVRMRRLMLDMSQESLGRALGLTFQQVQKYEKGANRIGASRLQQLADALQVPVAFFFEGVPMESCAGHAPNDGCAAYVSAFLATPDGLALVKAFMRINAAELRQRIVNLVEEVAGKAK